MSNKNLTVPYTYERILVQDAARLGHKVPHILTLGEVDVTEIRYQIRKYRRTLKKRLSISTYLLYCYVKTLEEFQHLQGYKGWSNKVTIFEDIDVMFPVELKNKTLEPKIIRSANRKNINDLEAEINAIKDKESVSISYAKKCFLKMPRIFRDFFYRAMVRTPKVRKDIFGTTLFSSPSFIADVKNNGKNVKAFGVSLPIQSIGICLGTKYPKLVLKNDCIEEKEFISFAIKGDHSIVDGAELGRFMSKYVQNISTTISTLVNE